MNSSDKDTLDTLLFDVQQYLLKNSWMRIEYGDDRLQVFESSNQDYAGLRISLPSAPDFIDAERRIRSAIDTMADVENTDREMFYKSLQSYNKDQILFRILTTEGVDSIPISHAEDQIAGMKKLILYAASSEAKSSQFHSKPTKEAEAFIDRCEFGHTFRGSFGFTVYLRVSHRGQVVDALDAPFPRKIVERLSNGVKSIKSAAKNNQPTEIVGDYEKGLNSRMCDALSEISAGGKYDYSMEIDWAKSIIPSADLLDNSSIKITDDVVKLLDDASMQLKHVAPHQYSLCEYVSNLHCVNNPRDDDARRKIAMLHAHENYGRIEVFIGLDKSQYIDAVNAHRDRKRIKLSGQLQRTGGSWNLNDVSEFNVVQNL